VFFVVSEQDKSKRKHWGLEELRCIELERPGPKRRTTRSVKQSRRKGTS
jgi:hypothetical protein